AAARAKIEGDRIDVTAGAAGDSQPSAAIATKPRIRGILELAISTMHCHGLPRSPMTLSLHILGSNNVAASRGQRNVA
ncbi:MAG: hypothetical protein QGF53_03525, partial [Alphaproteobacteria bacterium]|nr:hypothetical protein [Alphaproteobacteria bacterium]